MMIEIAEWFPDRCFHLCADGAYATLAGANLPRTKITSRMRRDAALYEAAPPPTGKRGWPRTKGERLPTPTAFSATVPAEDWRTIQADSRGTTIERQIHVQDVLWYRVNKESLVRLVIVRDPQGVEPDDYFFTTDLTAGGADVLSRYAARWAIEVCFRDTKQDLGGQDPQSRKRQGPERAAALSLWLHAATWCWYVEAHRRGGRGSFGPGTGPRRPRASSMPWPHYAGKCGPTEYPKLPAPKPKPRKYPGRSLTRWPTRRDRTQNCESPHQQKRSRSSAGTSPGNPPNPATCSSLRKSTAMEPIQQAADSLA
ncbi:hypothetical protein [Paeniglutamicibacter gangotriensis]|uniref:Transposase IS4-like domain-containing protein n=1 Tax=Paeniglutamicibacter gangotriensis Lz1y TaxID=1276920 RepID=M7N4Y5_9MICC|nr:hypothetical protein [Paeniglutamicibacter gangotriensis]EMQ96809.1 hypothetical protein ADIAG_03946 [Paeniglutamicibacter gangotriensis Lz1y]